MAAFFLRVWRESPLDATVLRSIGLSQVWVEDQGDLHLVAYSGMVDYASTATSMNLQARSLGYQVESSPGQHAYYQGDLIRGVLIADHRYLVSGDLVSAPGYIAFWMPVRSGYRVLCDLWPKGQSVPGP